MEKPQEIQVPENLRYWESWRHVGPGMLKEIRGGNLNGKTDINPLWRFQALTEAFGPCGVGWTVKEKERWTNECAGEVGAFVKIELWIKFVDEVGNKAWSEPIEGVGGSKLCGKGRGEGLNDEAWKMATTDAISVACKSLGMAADVYTGKQTHADQDQQGRGDYGTKYEPRNTSTGQDTGRGGYSQNRGASAPRGGSYQTPPPSGQNYQQPTGPRQHQARVCEVVDIQKGKASRLIQVLSTYDFDDPDNWAKGLKWLREQVVLGEGAEALIVQKAVEMRQAYQQTQVDNVKLS